MYFYTESINCTLIVNLTYQKYVSLFYNSLYKLPSVYRLLAIILEIRTKGYKS
jgi:hypothetical protein